MKIREVYWGEVKAYDEIEQIKKNYKEFTIENFYFKKQNQQYLSELINRDKNIICGKKGSGKSYLLLNLKEKLKDKEKTHYMELSSQNYFTAKYDELEHSDKKISNEQLKTFWKFIIYSEVISYLHEEKKFSFYNRVTFLKHRTKRIHKKKIYDEVLLSKEVGRENKIASSILRAFRKKDADYSRTSSKKMQFNYNKLSNLNNKNIKKLKNIINKCIIKGEQMFITIDDLDLFFDNLDDKENYYTICYSLLQSIQEINQEFSTLNIIIAIRPEIIESISKISSDSSSSFKPKMITLIWNEENYSYNKMYKYDLAQFLLQRYKLFNKNSSESKKDIDLFKDLFQEYKKSNHEYVPKWIKDTEKDISNSFEYILKRGFNRPRDIISYMKHIQNYNLDAERINIDDVIGCEKQYSTDFMIELQNELNIYSHQLNILDLLDIIKAMKKKLFTKNELSQFITSNNLKKYSNDDLDQCLKILYKVNFIGYKVGRKYSFYYKDGSELLNTNASYIIHYGFHKNFSI